MMFKYAVTHMAIIWWVSLEFKLKDKCKEGRLDIQRIGGNKLFWDSSPYIAQASLKHEVLLPLFPEYCG